MKQIFKLKEVSFVNAFLIMVVILVVVGLINFIFFPTPVNNDRTLRETPAEKDYQQYNEAELDELESDQSNATILTRLEYLRSTNLEADYSALEENLPVLGNEFAIYRVDSELGTYLVLADNQIGLLEAEIFLGNYGISADDENIIVDNFGGEIEQQLLPDGI